MTVPWGDYPDGTFDDDLSGLNGIDEASWRASKFNQIDGFNTAHDRFKAEYISAPLFNGEVVRLDNRIDEIVVGTERAILWTFSEYGVWTKHPAAYKVVVDAISGGSGGSSGTNGSGSGAGGAGGFSGGWERFIFTGAALEALPSSVAVTIGAGTSGGSTATAGTSSFGSFGSSTGATPSNYGSGSRTYKMRGGAGGSVSVITGTDGSAGPFSSGGSGGSSGSVNGGNGFSAGVGQIGTGSAGGGGVGNTALFGSGGKGGHGGWPAAPGGGGGYGGGGGGAGGNGAGGAVFVTVYVEDTLGVPPSTPTGLAASSITRTSARVSWTASIDDVMVKNYILYLNGTRYAVVESTYHDFVGLTASAAYAVRVQAVDIGDNVSGLSTTLNFTTTA
ncbi:fibronectin type III domain-containing protein [Prescottella equi]|uniref:fibronectin type III domain-containing protein n=1 Tax=Rhodococcus hoagii TaxID=43767 RepID=UPI00197EBE3E|nr:fibronectin type III domain-containing protein [Prescottella equi]